MKLSTLFDIRTTVLAIALWFSTSAQAAVTLDRTRIIFDGTQQSINITIRNDNPELPYLAQSWLENDAEKNWKLALLLLRHQFSVWSQNPPA